MWTILEFIVITVPLFMCAVFFAMFTFAMVLNAVVAVFEWLSDILWNLKETWKEYWK